MLDLVSEKIQGAIKYIKGEGSITEKNIEKALRDVKLSLLSADVNYKVVNEFIKRVKEKALGEKVISSVMPGEQFIKIFNDELTRILGEENKPLKIPSQIPSYLMLVGLQGVGKTTTAGKLALYLKKQEFNPLLVSIDLKRPAAQQQLETIAKEIGVDFLKIEEKDVKSAVLRIEKSVKAKGYHPIIVDTAGRLHIEDELMMELKEVKEKIKPFEIMYVADSMTGADAVKSAQKFSEDIGIDSIILTKLDADSRGGAALSITYITQKPIKFVGIGEKYGNLDPFYPERLSSRILGMGDIVSLVEKAQEVIDQKEAERIAKKMAKKEFSLDDFLDNLKQVRKMGSLSDILAQMPKIPGMSKINKMAVDDKKIVHMEAILLSMTREERDNPVILNGKRRLRIAKGSGRPVSEVNQLLKQYREMKKIVKKGFFSKFTRMFDI
jgi:signal recognition particle subunit SRP54